MSYVESHFGPFGDSVKIGARYVPKIPHARKSFWTHFIELLGDMGHVESPFGPFRDSDSIGAR
jgi:hypothetical protein